jgi:ankyrin repeat protein
MDLIEAVDNGDIALVKLLLEGGADVNFEDHNHWTALFYAINIDRMDICNLLIDRGANVNKSDKTAWRWTPLMYAVDQSNIDIIKLLIISGADVNYNNINNASALHYALRRNNTNITNILRWRGATFGYDTIMDLLILLIYSRIIPRDLLREIHTKWIS